MERMHTLRSTELHRRTGTTLVELTLSLALFSSFAGTVFLAVDAAAGAYGTEATASRLDARARLTLDAATNCLREADFASLTPPAVAPPASASSLDFERSLGFAGGAVQWGPTERLTFEPDPGDPEDGLDNDGDGKTDEGRLTWLENPAMAGNRRVVLAADVSAALEGETLGNGLDDNGNGLVDERGFCVEFVGSRMLVRLTLEDLDHDQNRILRSAARTVTPRNTPED
jgi:hypothetical protein